MANHPSRPSLSLATFKGKIQTWRESATTSPSGLHLDHYNKAFFAKHRYSHKEPSDLTNEHDMKAKKEQLDSMQQDLQQLHLSLLNYALRRGHSFKRWQTITNSILFRDSDNFRLHRTRVIYIYEADFNLILGKKWREAMRAAKIKQWLNQGQFGSRSRRSAIDPVLVEELQYEISRATRNSVLFTNYDAASCCDRIVPNLAALISRRFGVHELVTKLNFSTLQKMKYKIRTEMGLTDTGYRHSAEFPIYGTGQGSANSPAIWCMLSSVLFDCYEEHASLAEYSDMTKSNTVKLGLIGFVDDCNGQTNWLDDEPYKSIPKLLLSKASKNAQLWADLLYASGGALELSKCSGHLVQWIFTTQGAPVLSPKLAERHEEKFSVTDPTTSSTIDIPVLSSYQSHKTLGHYKDPAGSQREQVRQLRKSCKLYTEFMWSSSLTRSEAQIFNSTCLLPAVSYPLACSAMSQRQLESIQKSLMSIIIARCGFNRHTNREIIYGPLHLGGAAFVSLYTQQGVGQVTLLLRHSRQESNIGKLLQISFLSWFQIQVGTSSPILEDTKSTLPHLESVWLKSIRQFLASIEGSIRLSLPEVISKQRIHDSVIMDIILESRRFTPREIRRLNYCRLYLKAITISDLATVNGDKLDLVKLQGHFLLIFSRTRGPFIYQERPSHQEWQLWERANRLWGDSDGNLRNPLGPWIIPLHNMRQDHFAYATEAQLWIQQGDHYIKCYRRCNDWYTESSSIAVKQDIPQPASPVEVRFAPPKSWNVIYWSTCQSSVN